MRSISEPRLDFFHHLSQEEAIGRIKERLGKGLEEKFGEKISNFQARWHGNKGEICEFEFKSRRSIPCGSELVPMESSFIGSLVVKVSRKVTIFLDTPFPTNIDKVREIREVVLGVKEAMEKLLT